MKNILLCQILFLIILGQRFNTPESHKTRYFNKMRIVDIDICIKCREDKETVEHFVKHCPIQDKDGVYLN